MLSATKSTVGPMGDTNQPVYLRESEVVLKPEEAAAMLPKQLDLEEGEILNADGISFI